MNTKRDNILIVTYHYLNGSGGGVFASRAFINAISQIYSSTHNVWLVHPSDEKHPAEKIKSDIHLVPIEDKSGRIKKVWNIISGKSRFLSIVKNLMDAYDFQMIIFDNSRASHNLIALAKTKVPIVITIHHNCELEYVRDNTSKLLRPILLHWVRKGEKDAVNKSDLNIVLTPEDRDLLLQHYSPNQDRHPIEVSGIFEFSHSILPPVAKDSGGYKDMPKIKNFPCFIITGNLSAKQSEESLLEWLKEYYPILKDIFPKSSVIIAGKSPSQNFKNICTKEGIEVHSSPKDMNPILEKGDIYICPISLGGGLKLRVMDGLKFGMPVLCHAVSARGYSKFTDAGFLFPYCNKQEFKKACYSLDRNFNKTDIRDLYLSCFSYKAGLKRLAHILP